MLQSLDTSSHTPLYWQLAQELERRITEGDWLPGEMIPSEPQMVRLYGVSRATVREAMRELIQKGRLKRKHGVGTFVLKPKRKNNSSS